MNFIIDVFSDSCLDKQNVRTQENVNLEVFFYNNLPENNQPLIVYT